MTELSKRYEVVGALTYYLYDYGMIEPEKIYTAVQGEKMQRPSKISTQLILMFKELNEFFAEIKQEAAEFAESFRSNPRMLEAHMNDIKNRLSAKVSDMFGIEYHYTISSVDFFRGGEVAEDGSRDLRGSFKKAVDDVCEELNKTLNTIFMHREENTYVVIRRVNDLNRLVHKLVRLRRKPADESSSAESADGRCDLIKIT